MRISGRGALALALAAATVGATGTAAEAAAGGRSTLPGSVPRWAQPSRDRGDADSSRRVTVKLYLALRDAAGAEALAQQVSDPTSASYGHYLSPAAFRQRFAGSAADRAAVAAFLRGAGLAVTDTTINHVEATGTLRQAETAFGTTVHRFACRGRLLEAPDRALSLPAALRGKVLAVSGLDQSGALIRPLNDTPGAAGAATAPAKHAGASAPPPDAFVNAPPCSSYFAEKLATRYPPVNGKPVPFAPCGYTPSQYQGAYGTAGLVARGLDGRGVTVAITDAYAAPTILQDANQYATRHGQPPFRGGQFKQLLPRRPFQYGYDDTANGNLCDEQGWYGEETLDVEAVHAMAPGANVVYSAGRSCLDDGLLPAIERIVDGRRADIITNSWGDIETNETPDVVRAYTIVFLQSALEGIGIFYSSGDSGDNSDTGAVVADFPASHPLVTAVGGTSLGVNARNGYEFETGWATGTSDLSADGTAWEPPFPGAFLYGGGGGVSALFGEPAYQRAAVPAAVANGHRAYPDVAMDGDPQTGMLVGETQTFPDGSERYSEYRIGGTSLSSPLYAGVEALADQAAGRPHGFVNPALYRLNGTGAVHDVKGPSPYPAVVRVNYNNSVDASEGRSVVLRSLDDEAQSLHLAPGWDTLTGIGTPNGAAFLGALARR
jgi:subtilase family serine protease